MRVSVIGLGNMGRPIAGNLLAAGFDVTVWNRTPERARELVARGATHARSVADAAQSGLVVTMLSDDRALEHVVFAERLIEALPQGAIHVSMSTISLALAERLTADHDRHGTDFVSAPVFGRPEMAAAAKLFVVASGPQAALDRCDPLFAAVGQRTFRFGDAPRAATLIKLSGNFLLAAAIESLAEAIALVRKTGVDPHAYVEMLTSTLFAAPAYKTYSGLIADERYHPAGFRLPLGLKDVTLALEAGRDLRAPLPVASVVRDHMIAALAQGFEDADWSVLGKLAAKNAGLP
jgi:3-hydroxyisobutyrate dehydrogenase-like beta-hydroxyacid dehydrogenase